MNEERFEPWYRDPFVIAMAWLGVVWVLILWGIAEIYQHVF